jgi:ATP-binding cassette subfamily F protein 3
MTVGEARNHLGRFLFTADDVFKPVSALSGGERAKLAMALMTLSPANLLILDEPTNHLDVFSCDALTEALQQFNGTMLLISHDRELLDAVTNHTLHLYGDGKFCLRTGSYSAMEDTEVLAGKPPNAPAAPATPAKKNAPPPPPPALSAHALAKERQKAKKRVETIEAEVAALEARLAEITATLSTPGADALALSQEYATQEAALTEKLSQWEAATLEAEELGT